MAQIFWSAILSNIEITTKIKVNIAIIFLFIKDCKKMSSKPFPSQNPQINDSYF